MTLDVHHYLRFLLHGAKFQELLNDVVAEHIDNELIRVVDDLVEDQLSVRNGTAFQLLLNKTAPVLIFKQS